MDLLQAETIFPSALLLPINRRSPSSIASGCADTADYQDNYVYSKH
jgi:hypothetical protein